MEFVYYEQCGHILYIISLTIHVLSKASVGILWVPYQSNLKRNINVVSDVYAKQGKNMGRSINGLMMKNQLGILNLEGGLFVLID